MKLVVVLLGLAGVGACQSRQENLVQQGNVLIEQIEAFQHENSILPQTLEDIGIGRQDESGPLYYLRKSDTNYIVWFGNELGESTIWDSDTKEWR